jgi:hypothetical protein
MPHPPQAFHKRISLRGLVREKLLAMMPSQTSHCENTRHGGRIMIPTPQVFLLGAEAVFAKYEL